MELRKETLIASAFICVHPRLQSFEWCFLRSFAVAVPEGGGDSTQRSEDAVDEEFTDAEIRTLLERAASGRRRDEMRRRLERAGSPRDKSDDTTTETPRETPLEERPAA
jgi:hypothetical protein